MSPYLYTTAAHFHVKVGGVGGWAPSRQLAAESQSHTGYVCVSEEARGRGAAGDQLATAEVGKKEGGGG